MTDKLKRLLITLALKVPIEQPVEDRALGRHDGEQRRAGFQLQVVGRAEDLVRRLPLDAQGRLGTFDQPRPEDGMGQVRLGLGVERIREVKFGSAS